MDKSAALFEIIENFKKKFGITPEHAVLSPLRICPLGAHVDHQYGIVTGMALTESVNLILSPNDDGYVRVQSHDFPDEEYFHMDHVPDMVPTFWGNYLRGAVLSLQRKHILRRGINGVVQGKIPIGGLSSSAAVTTAYLMALCKVNDIELTPLELIEHSHWVELSFIGINNGILDQSANILSLNHHLMQIDCKSMEYDRIPAASDMPEFEVIIVYSGITRNLIKTDYNNRVDECKVSAWILQEIENGTVSSFNDITFRDIPIDIYEKHRDKLPGRFQRRANHYFNEQRRVASGVKAWSEGNLETFGQLIFESGESSIYQYESGCPELIDIYETLRNSEGVYGARFSGAGYRGCCIGLIDPEYKDKIKARIDNSYPTRFPKYKDESQVFYCNTDDGARIIDL